VLLIVKTIGADSDSQGRFQRFAPYPDFSTRQIARAGMRIVWPSWVL
jgi:hypothetical protein